MPFEPARFEPAAEAAGHAHLGLVRAKPNRDAPPLPRRARTRRLERAGWAISDVWERLPIVDVIDDLLKVALVENEVDLAAFRPPALAA